VLDGENRREAALIQVSFAKNMKRVLAGMSAPQQADSSIWNWVLPKYSDGARSPSALEGAEGICFLCILPILGSFFRFAKLVFTFSSRIPPRGRNWLSSENALAAGSNPFVSVGRSPQWVRFFEWASSDAERWVFTLARVLFCNFPPDARNVPCPEPEITAEIRPEFSYLLIPVTFAALTSENRRETAGRYSRNYAETKCCRSIHFFRPSSTASARTRI
jgi:hypothetical protein